MRSATREVESIFASAREIALSQSAYTTVAIIKDPPSLNLVIDGEMEDANTPPVQISTLLRELYGVSITSNRSAVTYGPNGITTGVANFTITISKGASSDTITMSRLGRIRHSSS